jgi:outer membrane protein TolC
MKNTLLIKIAAFGITFMVLNSMAIAQTLTPPGENPSLTLLVNKGIDENEKLKSRTILADAKKNEAVAAGSLENPRIGFAMLNLPADSFETDAEPMTQKQVFIAQKVPWFGKRDLKTEVKLHEADQLSADAIIFRNTLSFKIRSLYYDVSFIQNSIDINKKISGLVQNTLSSLEEAYTSGRGSREKILGMQIHHSRLLEERIVLTEKLETSKNKLRELVDLPDNFRFTLPHKLSSEYTDDYFTNLKEKSLTDNPELLRKKAGTGKAEAMVREAEKDYFPDMDLKLSYAQREDTSSGVERSDFVSASVTFSIPLWQNSRQDKIKASKKKILSASKSDVKDYTRVIEFRVNTLIEKIRAAEKGFQLTGELINAQLAELEASSAKGYEGGSSSFESVMDSKIKVLQNRLKNYRYVADFYKLNSELLSIASY